MPARQDAVHGATASAILEVAEGLRWRDPQLSAALAEHAVRLAGGDADVRGAAERSAILALGQLDRGADVVARALPHLREAERAGRTADAASLRCELAAAAVRCEDPDLAEALLEPVADGAVLPAAVRLDALIAWAGVRALRGDVDGTDASAAQAEALLGETGGLDALRRIDLHRVRAMARRHRGDAAAALEVLRAAPAAGDPGGEDGGRRAALLVADQVDLLLDLHRASEARAAAVTVLGWPPEEATAVPLGRVRCALAGRAHLPAGELDVAEALARAAERDLGPRGHDEQAAAALEVLASVAERRGDLPGTADALRRAHTLALAAHDAVARTRIALTTAATTTTAPASGNGPVAGDGPPPVPAVPATSTAPEPPHTPDATAPRRTRSSRRAAERASGSADETTTSESASKREATPWSTAELPGGTRSTSARTAAEPTASTATPHPVPPRPADPAPRARRRQPEGETTEAPAGRPPGGARHRGPDTDGEREAAAKAPEDAVPPEPPVTENGVGAPAPASVEAAPAPVARRRGRYREDASPDPRPAAPPPDASFDAFSTAPAAPDPPSEPVPEPAARHGNGMLGDQSGRDNGPGRGSSNPLGLGADPLGGPDAPERGNGSGATPGTPPGADAHDGRDAGESAEESGTRRARERWESAVSLLPQRGAVRQNGHDVLAGDRRAGAPASDRPPAERSSSAPGGAWAASGVPGRDTTAGRRDLLSATTPGPEAGDEDLARELALTLVGLLAEYGEPDGPPPDPRTARTGTAPSPWSFTSSGSSEERTGLVPARPAVSPPATGNGRGPTPRPPESATGRDRPATERPGTGRAPLGAAVPPARRADDSGAKLADLLAEAMDAFRRTGQDSAAPTVAPPADDVRRVRR